MQMEVNTLNFSESLLTILGIDIDSFIAMTMRGKSPEIFGWKSRLLFLKHKLISLLGTFSTCSFSIDLLSSEGMNVPGRFNKHSVSFNLDEKFPQLPFGLTQEMLIIYFIEFEEITLKQLSYIRQQCGILKQQGERHVDSEHAPQVQAFLDMYYKSFPKNNNKAKTTKQQKQHIS